MQSSTSKTQALKLRAKRMMRRIEDEIGPVQSEWSNKARIDLFSELIQEIELAIDEAKELTFGS